MDPVSKLSLHGLTKAYSNQDSFYKKQTVQSVDNNGICHNTKIISNKHKELIIF